MDIERARYNMIEQQIRTWEVLDQGVLDTLYVVRREEFVPAAFRGQAFTDMEIPLNSARRASQHMLQPKVEARILQEVAPKKSERVLEIGTGTGYMAALLAAKCASVVSVELDPALLEIAQANLARAGIANVKLEPGDAALGWTKQAPYDVIVVSGSLPIMPPELREQLKPGGRLFAIVGDAPVMAARLVTRTAASTFESIDLFETCVASLEHARQPARFTF